VILWRVSNHAVLDGAGGLRAPGRWHTRGKPIVYCAGNAAAALLETLVHTEIDFEDIPVAFRYLEIEAADSLTVEAIHPADLGSAWQMKLDHTRRTGDEWLHSGRTAILRVPSVIAPQTWNFLINPGHPGSAAIRIARVHSYVVDQRLLRQAHTNAGSKTSTEPMRRREPHR
jgi:RES domain-containing protein